MTFIYGLIKGGSNPEFNCSVTLQKCCNEELLPRLERASIPRALPTRPPPSPPHQPQTVNQLSAHTALSYTRWGWRRTTRREKKEEEKKKDQRERQPARDDDCSLPLRTFFPCVSAERTHLPHFYTKNQKATNWWQQRRKSVKRNEMSMSRLNPQEPLALG